MFLSRIFTKINFGLNEFFLQEKTKHSYFILEYYVFVIVTPEKRFR